MSDYTIRYVMACAMIIVIAFSIGQCSQTYTQEEKTKQVLGEACIKTGHRWAKGFSDNWYCTDK